MNPKFHKPYWCLWQKLNSWRSVRRETHDSGSGDQCQMHACSNWLEDCTPKAVRTERTRVWSRWEVLQQPGWETQARGTRRVSTAAEGSSHVGVTSVVIHLSAPETSQNLYLSPSDPRVRERHEFWEIVEASASTQGVRSSKFCTNPMPCWQFCKSTEQQPHLPTNSNLQRKNHWTNTTNHTT